MHGRPVTFRNSPEMPRYILIVENCDCRLWFPEFKHRIIVE
ncbi:hypothetical protein BJ994_001117 [Arthrobacter pigmenti]|uniref:Uncharacterized protein n=1 Tax=Arthrobacter pigmenti TaxID=271432 RepID=A0A846RUU1_9MICC|nr:hypothetical protein [Arthrobacter pigmenti]